MQKGKKKNRVSRSIRRILKKDRTKRTMLVGEEMEASLQENEP